MKKILFLMDDINYRGGAHFVTFNICNLLKENGNDVSIYSLTKPNQETYQYLTDGIHFAKSKNFEHYEYVVVPFENSIFKEEVANLKKIKKIQWIHIDYDEWAKKTKANLENERKIYKCYDKIIFVSKGAEDSFVKYFPEYKDKCKVIYNILDTNLIRKKAEIELGEEFHIKHNECLNILLVGRLEPQKNYNRIIDVAKILKEQQININWYILGKGYQYSELKKRAKYYKLENIKFLGYKKNPYPYMKKADIVGLLSDYEGFGLVAVESMIIGTPILATKTTGVTEIFDEKGGWLIENSIFSIIDKITEIYKDRSLLDEKKKSIQSYTYDNNSIAKNILNVFGGDTEKVKFDKIGTNLEKIELEPKVSIIVPVYNMENYLQECLESLVEQTLDDIEIIIVNDGSTDDSQDIIDEFAYEYSDKIRAFTIKNSGLGEARNFGLKQAKGKYVGFVDSDDVVSKDMYEKLYKQANKENADLVICDYIAFWDNGNKEYVKSITDKGADRFEIIKYSTKYGIVNAVTKLVDKELAEKMPFPKGFYEDLATIPIWLTYAKTITYLPEGLYYYRQRAGSITSIKNNDKRLMDSFNCWNRISEFSNPIYKKEIAYALYWSLNFFCTNFLDGFTQCSKQYYDTHNEIFENNAYITQAIKENKLVDFSSMKKIPEIIHYCWFGKGEKGPLIEKCIRSWREYAPNFKIIEWNEENCDINENEYVKVAYEKKQWAFVSDYFRIKALYEMGGVYLDTDMELTKPIEPYLYDEGFFAFETPIFVHAGIIGAQKENDIIKKIYETYKTDEFKEWKDSIPYPIPRRITDVLKKNTNLILNGKTQRLNNGIRVYSANKMTMNMHDGQNIANHHYEGNWLKKENLSSYNYGYEVLKHYFTWDLLHDSKKEISQINNESWDGILNYKVLYEDMVNSTCWKITKPLRIVMDFVRKRN